MPMLVSISMLVSMPILFLSCKGHWNFAVQQVLFIGTTGLDGLSAIRKKYAHPPTFSVASRAFQVIGQASTAASYIKIMSATQPWQGSSAALTGALLVSQHASTITEQELVLHASEVVRVDEIRLHLLS